MSLKDFVKDKEVRERFAPPRAAVPLPHRLPVRVPPRSEQRGIVGTAFDYLLRFEIKRRAPHAVERQWIAESSWDPS